MKHLITLISALFLLTSFAGAQVNPFADAPEEQKKTKANLYSEVSSTAAGETFTIAIELEHTEGWHSYYHNPGGPGLPLEFAWELPEGYELKALHWPTPHLYTSNETLFYVYEGKYTFLADISTPSLAKAAETPVITVTPTWQLCDATGCLPPTSEALIISVPVGEEQVTDPAQAELFKNARTKLPRENDTFEITTETFGNLVTFTIKDIKESGASLENAHLIDNAGIFDSQIPQTIVELPLYHTLTATLKEGAQLPTVIDGLLVISDEKAYSVSIPTDANAAPIVANQPAKTTNIQHAAPTPEQIAAAAKLYNPDTKIDYVLLDGTKEKSHTIWTALGFIFLGGFLLNLMPCVFPVLGIKVMGFVQQAGSDARKIKIHGLAFMAGLVVSMWILAAIIYILIGVFGKDINWGQQLTSPAFLAFMIALLFLFGLNLAGVFEVGTSLTGAGGELQAKKGYSGSFFSGVLTTLIATPCSGPFLGSVLGYTLKQPPLQGMIIFTVFALGISVPYVLLSFFPKLINKLPRPGGWMVTFKQIMAFALFATAAYFFQSFAKITGTTGASWLVMALVIISLAAWAYGKFGTPYTPKVKKYIWGIGFPLLVASGGLYITKAAVAERAPTPPLTESSWYPGVVEQNRAKKRVVWVDYTADW